MARDESDPPQQAVARFVGAGDYGAGMSRFRMNPEPGQERVLLEHCAHARFVWNLAVEQQGMYTPRKGPVPGFAEQCRQLTEARAEFAWLAAGSQTVQQQALRDFAQAMSNFFRGTHRKPTWRKAEIDEGFRIVGGQAQRVERLGKHVGRVWVPKAGWVRFRWSRQVPKAKSYRITRDRAGRWFVAFAVAPDPIPAPGTGAEVGVDRGIAVSAALSADVNAARNIRDIAAGRAVAAREGTGASEPVNREPQLGFAS